MPPMVSGAAVGLLLADDHAEERRLAGPVGPDDADDAARGQDEREPVDEQAVAEGLHDAAGLHHLVTQAGPGRDDQLHLVGAALRASASATRSL